MFNFIVLFFFFLGISILLSLSIYSMQVPTKSSIVPLITVYVTMLVATCASNIVMNVLVLNLFHKDPSKHMPKFVQKILCVWLAWIVRLKKPKVKMSAERKEGEVSSELNSSEPQTIAGANDWKLAAVVLERIFLFVILVAWITISLLVFLNINNSGKLHF